MHIQSDVFADGFLQKGKGLLRQLSQHHSGVCRRVDSPQLHDELRGSHAGSAHGFGEERLLAGEMPQHCRCSDVELDGDIGQRGGLESLLGEHAASRVQELRTADPRRASHL